MSEAQTPRGDDMVPVTDELLRRMVAVIVEEVEPEQVYLFGSHARGDATERSDVDLLVVERDSFGPERSRRKEAGRLYRVLAHFGVPKDILVYTAEEVERRRDGRNNVVARALREGRLLYDRP
jgi:predicted nucleotidyltransferase